MTTHVTTHMGHLDVKVVAPTIEAGIPTTIDLIIRNPFDQSISILAIKSPGSSAIRETTSDTETHVGTTDGDSSFSRKLWGRLSKFKNLTSGGGGNHCAISWGREKGIMIEAAPGATVEWNRPVPENAEFRIEAAKDSKVLIQLSKEEIEAGIGGKKKPIQIVSAGPEVIASFELMTTRWLLFKPLEITLYAQVEYLVGNTITSQVGPVPISIKAPLRSILIGSNLGALFGFLARQIKEGGLKPPVFHGADFLLGYSERLLWQLLPLSPLREKSPPRDS